MLKVVYSWIGPKGPVWNTETPNLFSLTTQAEKIKTESHHFWCDIMWQSLFKNRKEEWYLWPNCEIEPEDIFVFPYNLYWRIPVERYFMAGSGIIEFSHMSGHTLQQIRTGKGFILIELAVEAYIDNLILTNMHHYFNVSLGLPMNKIIYVTGCMNAKQIYDEWCQRNNIPDRPDQRMHVISFPSSQAIFARQVRQNELIEPNYDISSIPEKLFLSFNRRFRQHRLNLSMAMNKHNLIERCYWALNKTDPESPRPFLDEVDVNSNLYLELKPDDAVNLYNKLPLVIDGETEIGQMCADREMATRKFYTNSLISLVTETNFREPNVSLTEKSFKPVKEKHPFIIVGSAFSLQSMRDLGFKTFSDFWDESYDTIQNHNQRMLAILNLCIEISKWDNNKILEFKRQVKPILDHNFNVICNKPEVGISEKIAKYMIEQLVLTGKMDSQTANLMKLNKRIP